MHIVRRRSIALGLLSLAGFLSLGQSAVGQTWTRLTNNAPGAVNLMLLLSDGTVMCANNNGTSTIGNAWYRLTPNASGSYVNGTWTTLASMIDTRLYYSSQVLQDGRVLVAGGEYGTGGARGEVYNPLTNTWTAAPIPTSVLDPSQPSPAIGGNQIIYDANSMLLANGTVLITPVGPKTSGGTIIYIPTTNTWITGPRLFRGVYQDEASWVKLPDQTILTIDPFGTNSERYNPATNTWINDSTVPVSLYDSFGSELGGALYLPNGKAFYLGSTGHTALYTPSGNTSPGTWVAGPDIPGSRGTPDAPASMLLNGKVLCAVSPLPTSANHFPSPTTFLEYDPVANSFAAVNAPVGTSDNRPTYTTAMLCLPNGGVLYSHMGNDLYIYTPAGSPIAAGKPTINSVSQNADGTYHLVGLGLNGISCGASYGDDLQMDSNYPIVRLTSGSNVYYARTFNWSSTGIATGSQVVTTEFRLPTGLPAGTYSLYAVANGIASDPISFTPGSVCTAASVTSGPSAQNICANSPASFSVTASGTAPLTYQWRKNTANISGATTSTYNIPSATAADIGSYDCVVSNGCGTATSSAASLSINSGPVISTQPSPTLGCVGQPASLTVIASSVGTYQWRKGGGNIAGANTATYSISSVSAGDAGSYDCVLTNSCGNVTTNAVQLTVSTGASISNQPSSLTRCVGSSAQFSVTASGSPAPTYQWRKGGTNISGATAATFSIASVVGGDAGNYDCIVTNSCATLTSNTATLTVNTPITFSQQPASSTLCEGDAATVSVTVSGTGPLTYHWRKNGQFISAFGPVYSFSPAVPENSGAYDCIVTGACGSVTSNQATITVNGPPVLTGPDAAAVCPGAPVSFTVVASGTGPFSYQWQRDNADIPSATGSTFSIAAAAPADLGSYQCIVTGLCGVNASTAAELSFLDAPVINGQPSNHADCTGATVNFTIAASGASGYQWMKDGQPLVNGPATGGSVISGASAAQLTISNCSSADDGAYTCTALSDCGNVLSQPGTLSIASPPAVTSQPTAQNSCIGGSAAFSLSAAPGLPVTYQWRRNGAPIAGATDVSLSINPVMSISAGSYDCVLTNDCGSTTSDAAALSVCAADFNCSGVVSVQDIFDFFAAYFAGGPSGDFNGSGVISVQDIFDFLSSYFAGCT